MKNILLIAFSEVALLALDLKKMIYKAILILWDIFGNIKAIKSFATLFISFLIISFFRAVFFPDYIVPVSNKLGGILAIMLLIFAIIKIWQYEEDL